jgi:hypothetical protein
MDPLSFILSTYIDTVSTVSTNHVSEIYGTEIQAVTVDYNGRKIPYAYQLWKIKPESVCATYKDQLSIYSDCTLDAKAMFNQVCDHLQKNPYQHWKYQKNKNMYCAAAISYSPVVAKVEKAAEPSTLELAKSECNLAITANMGDGSSKAQRAIEKACSEYKSLSK